MFKGKCVILGVSGGIAAYKACDLARLFVKDGMEVNVVMTASAVKFVQPMTFRALTGNDVGVDLFSSRESIAHIALARKASAVVIAPATANLIARLACGMADDLLTTLVLAARVPVILAPAMNTAMWENIATRENVEKLKSRGFLFVGPASGEMACGEFGEGKLADIEDIANAARITIAEPKNLKGRKFIVTSGPTREPIDPVRYISNRSSGRMGTAIAAALMRRGAEAAFVHGPSEVKPPYGAKIYPVESALEMRNRTMELWPSADGAVLVAAVADFRPAVISSRKIKKRDGLLEIKLEETDDILADLGKTRGSRFLAGFAAETDGLVANAAEKLKKKNLDMIVANDVSAAGIGFGSERNSVVILCSDGKRRDVPEASKEEVSWEITDEIGRMINGH